MTHNELPLPPARHTGLRAGHVVLVTLLGIFFLCIVGVVGMFRLSSETAVLRQSMMSCVIGGWDKKIALRFGVFTTGLVRAGARCVNLPAEARAALESLRGVEVGVYSLTGQIARWDGGEALKKADKALAARGWERAVGVLQGRELVAVYVPHKPGWGGRLKCCLMVFNGHELVVASVSGNPGPLLSLAEEHLRATIGKS
jgi:hypothetical protein